MIDLGEVAGIKIDDNDIKSLFVNGDLLWEAVAWEDPVQAEDTLYITQVYSAVQNGEKLEVA